MTNSITNAAYFAEDELKSAVPLINNLSVDLNMLRPSMLETGLESIAYNLNRKNTNLSFFEFGRTYGKSGPGKYQEAEHLCLFISGNNVEDSWRMKAKPADFFQIKGVVGAVLQLLGIAPDGSGFLNESRFSEGGTFTAGGQNLVRFGSVSRKIMEQFGIKQPVYFADFDWDLIIEKAVRSNQAFQSIPRFPAVQRDLAIVVPQQLPFEKVEQSVQKIKLNKLQTIKLFDIFESEKLGAGKKSMAMNFTFLDGEKTLTDKEIEGWMKTIIDTLEKDLQAEIRK
jgi:phenylalanyl-tRNA synthetase beta chain